MAVIHRSEKHSTEYSFQLPGIEDIIEIEIVTHSNVNNGHYSLLIRRGLENDVIARFYSGKYYGGTIDGKVVESLKKESERGFINGDYSRLQTCLRGMVFEKSDEKPSRNGKPKYYGTIRAGIGGR